MTGLRAIMVAVNYDDLLTVTLPYNRHHFDEVWILTDPDSQRKVRELAIPLGCEVLSTDLFYRRGAVFNKWAALEWGLDQMGRQGWLCVMDADVLWPKEVQVAEFGRSLRLGWPTGDLLLDRGELMTPLRRMAPWPFQENYAGLWEVGHDYVPHESIWNKWPIHRNVKEWAGYTQVFHASDPTLGKPPWHEVDWRHAGGADSIFQRKWPMNLKRRPAWEVLHLGDSGQNWFGRATPYADGTEPEGAEWRRRAIKQVWATRAQRRGQGMGEADTFKPEKLG